MTLSDLRTKLGNYKGTAEQVHLDFASFMNEQDPSVRKYPAIIWDMDGVRGTMNTRKTEKTLPINVFCTGKYTPDDDKIDAWDELEEVLQAHLALVDADDDLSIEDQEAYEFEYYPVGLLNVEYEYGVRYRVTLKLWC